MSLNSVHVKVDYGSLCCGIQRTFRWMSGSLRFCVAGFSTFFLMMSGSVVLLYKIGGISTFCNKYDCIMDYYALKLHIKNILISAKFSIT